MRPRRDTEDGFTLVEMIITMVIVAILMGIAIVTLTSAKARAKEKRTEAHMRSAVNVIQKARDRRQQHLGAFVTSNAGACAADNLPTVEQGGPCVTAMRTMATALAPYAGSQAAAEEMLTDGSGRPMVIDISESPGNCAGTDTIRAQNPDGRWASRRVTVRIPNSGYAC